MTTSQFNSSKSKPTNIRELRTKFIVTMLIMIALVVTTFVSEVRFLEKVATISLVIFVTVLHGLVLILLSWLSCLIWTVYRQMKLNMIKEKIKQISVSNPSPKLIEQKIQENKGEEVAEKLHDEIKITQNKQE